MAFGKKKDDAPTPDDVDAPEDEATAPESDALAPAAADAPPSGEPAAAAEAAAPAAAGSDALLSMFAESKTESDNDLTVLVNLAGDADLDDILEELRTIRAALGITDAFDEEEDFAAAA